MMDERERRNFEMLLAGPCASPDYIAGYYGLDWPLPEPASRDYEAWEKRRSSRDPAPCESGTSRFDLERFMQQQAVVPRKWAAAGLGMEVDSFDELMQRLPDLGMRPERYIVDQAFVADTLIDGLIPNLPGLRFRTFTDHDNLCERLHEAVKVELGIEVRALFCATSEQMGESPRRFARDFDCITLKPLSPRHELWLDFRKPLNLQPDRCSKLLYVQNREELRRYCAGTREPDDLGGYTQFLAERVHA